MPESHRLPYSPQIWGTAHYSVSVAKVTRPAGWVNRGYGPLIYCWQVRTARKFFPGVALMVRIIGVDFSGAGSDDHKGKTWVTEGWFDGITLTIRNCRAISRNGLVDLLTLNQLPNDTVVAMDFPFGVSRELARRLRPGALTLPSVWGGAEEMGDLGIFRALCKSFGLRPKKFGELKEPKRAGDIHYPQSISPLNLRMIPMTFRGMQMLSRLWHCDDLRFRVPPLQCPDRTGPILLEVMPGAVIRNFCLPYRNYKERNQANGGYPQGVRQEILDGLMRLPGLCLDIPPRLYDNCVENDDCLDSLVAAIGAALWVRDESQFLHPTGDELPTARLEGWIYAPIFPRHQRG